MEPIVAATRSREGGRRVTAMVVLSLAMILGACSRKTSDDAGSEGAAWLMSGTDDERFERVAKHLRGLDLAMAEVGYRYGELHWAGEDGNWDYAKYQIDKIRLAVANGVERRPKRAESAKILEPALAGIEEAVAAKDPALFAVRFEQLTRTCNACHLVEQVGFMHVQRPTTRNSMIRPVPTGGAGK
jgi:hypothetical protein